MATWATWAVPYKQLSIDQQRAAWFMDGNSKMKGQHPVWKAATLIEEGKNKSARQAELHDVCPYVWVFTNSQEVFSGLVIWSGRRAMENWSTKWMLVWGIAYGSHSGNVRGMFKQDTSMPIRRTPFRKWKVIGTGEQISRMHA